MHTWNDDSVAELALDDELGAGGQQGVQKLVVLPVVPDHMTMMKCQFLGT